MGFAGSEKKVLILFTDGTPTRDKNSTDDCGNHIAPGFATAGTSAGDSVEEDVEVDETTDVAALVVRVSPSVGGSVENSVENFVAGATKENDSEFESMNPTPVALKMFFTSLDQFSNRAEYVDGDPRYVVRGGGVGGGGDGDGDSDGSGDGGDGGGNSGNGGGDGGTRPSSPSLPLSPLSMLSITSRLSLFYPTFITTSSSQVQG